MIEINNQIIIFRFKQWSPKTLKAYNKLTTFKKTFCALIFCSLNLCGPK